MIYILPLNVMQFMQLQYIYTLALVVTWSGYVYYISLWQSLLRS